jgi:hypothetical protein
LERAEKHAVACRSMCLSDGAVEERWARFQLCAHLVPTGREQMIVAKETAQQDSHSFYLGHHLNVGSGQGNRKFLA